MNERIRAREVRVIGADGEQLGILPIREALTKAQEAELDLVEVAPTAQPPVCRIMDYGRYKYEQGKRERGSHRHARATDIKGMRMSPNIGEHDFQVKARQVFNFLKDGHKVRVSMWFRGRQMAHPKIGELLLVRLAETVGEIGGIERPPLLEGRNMIMILTPKRSG